VQCLDCLLGPVLVHEAEPNREAHDDEDDQGVHARPNKDGYRCRRCQQDEERVPELSEEDPQGRVPWLTTALGPTAWSRRDASISTKTDSDVSRRAKTVPDCMKAASASSRPLHPSEISPMSAVVGSESGYRAPEVRRSKRRRSFPLGR